MSAIQTVGLVGAGRIADVHAAAARACGAMIAGVVSSTPERGREAARRLGIPRAHRTVAELVADPTIQAVHITSPTTLHAEQAITVIEAGKHVICEKPIALTVDDAQHLVDAARSAGIVGTVPFTYRFHPVAQEARAHVSGGRLGRLRTVRGDYLQDWLLGVAPHRAEQPSIDGAISSVFLDIGSHLVDLAEFITGVRVRRVVASRDEQASSPSAVIVEQGAVALLVEFESGAIGSLLVSQTAPGHANALTVEVSGSRSSLTVDLERTRQLQVGTPGRSELIDLAAPAPHALAARLRYVPTGGPEDHVDAFTAFVSDSYAAMTGASLVGLPTLRDGLRSAQVSDAVHRSLLTGDWQDVPSDA